MNIKENIILKSFKILDKKILIFFALMTVSSILVSFIELLGIGFLGSFVMILTDIKGSLYEISKYEVFSFLNDLDEKNIIYLFLILIIIFFIIKNIIFFIFFYYFSKFKAFFNYQISKKLFLENIQNNYQYFLNQKKSKIIHDIKEESIRFTGVFFSILNTSDHNLINN